MLHRHVGAVTLFTGLFRYLDLCSLTVNMTSILSKNHIGIFLSSKQYGWSGSEELTCTPEKLLYIYIYTLYINIYLR